MLNLLYLEDDGASVELARLTLRRAGVDARLEVVSGQEGFVQACARGGYDVILSDYDVPGYSGMAALREARRREPHLPFVFVCGVGGRERELSCLEAGADEYVLKDHLWRLPVVVRRLLEVRSGPSRAPAAASPERPGAARLVAAAQALARARTAEAVAGSVTQAARELTGAEGATLMRLTEGRCSLSAEDAVSPLWQGRPFPEDGDIGGWVARHREAAVIENVDQDPRLNPEVYRSTFVKSLAAVPVGQEAALAVLAVYWARPHRASSEELELLGGLAALTGVVLERQQVQAELEQRLRDRTAELTAATRELEAYTYSVSHDLRTPVGQVMGFADLLEETMAGSKLDGQEKVYVQHMVGAARRINELVENLLRLGRVSRAEMVKLPVDLSAVAREVIAELAERQPDRVVQVRIEEGLASHADPRLIRQVLEHLLSNAFKFTGPEPHPVIDVVAGPELPGQRTFLVRDNGVGFDPQQASRLFSPFGRLHRAEEFPGAGVGLAISQRVLHRHGGRLWAESSPGAGATFFFSLPLASASGPP